MRPGSGSAASPGIRRTRQGLPRAEVWGLPVKRARPTRRWLLVALGLWAACSPVRADSGSQQLQLAMNGRFDRLEQLLEGEAARGPLRTRDRHALCYAYSMTKRYDRLMPCLDKLEEGVRAGDRRTRLFGLDDATPSIHLMRADALLELGQYRAAFEQARKGLEWLRARRSDELDMVIRCLASMSLASTLSGDREGGEQHVQELAKLRVSVITPEYVTAKSLALARSYMALGKYDQALEALESDRTFRIGNFLDNLVSGAFLRGVNNWVWAELPRSFMITKALYETGRIPEARRGYDDLLKIPQVRANGEIFWQLMHDRARIAERDGDTGKAIGLYQRAVEVIERQRLTVNTETNKIGFIGDKQAVYGRLVDALIVAGRNEEAFEYAERAKARALVDLLARRENAERPVVTGRQASATALDQYRAATKDALAQVPLDMSNPELPDTQRASVQAAEELQRTDPETASMMGLTSVSIAEIRERLRPDEVIVQYYASGERLLALAVTRTQVRVTPIDAQGLQASVMRLRALIEKVDDGVTAEARALYDRLLRPMASVIEGRNLLLVPHGVLHYLPFSALHDGQDYIVRRHLLRYLPSASVLKFLKTANSSTAPGRLLVFGNPDLDKPELDLPFAEKEAVLIGSLVPGSRVVLRKEATESRLMELAPAYRYIHIASHGQFNAGDAMQSRLLLRADGAHDGSLTVSEIYGLRLDAELVTLSACETGLGKVLTGDDVLGLKRGFLYAGTRNILATHWEVDDEATGELMKTFYNRLLAGLPKREALRQAQLETRRVYAHPFFWSAFYLTGNGE